jgi:hypothetical protein
MSPPNYVSIFNEHFIEFIQDIQVAFPTDVDLQTAKNSLLAIKKANPRLLSKIWKQYVVGPYIEKIESGDINFFLVKDYSHDLQQTDNSSKIIEAINRLREPIRNMTQENQEKTMKYIQNLTKLSMLIE